MPRTLRLFLDCFRSLVTNPERREMSDVEGSLDIYFTLSSISMISRFHPCDVYNAKEALFSFSKSAVIMYLNGYDGLTADGTITKGRLLQNYFESYINGFGSHGKVFVPVWAQGLSNDACCFCLLRVDGHHSKGIRKRYEVAFYETIRSKNWTSIEMVSSKR